MDLVLSKDLVRRNSSCCPGPKAPGPIHAQISPTPETRLRSAGLGPLGPVHHRFAWSRGPGLSIATNAWFVNVPSSLPNASVPQKQLGMPGYFTLGRRLAPPALWDLPGSPLIRVLPGAPRLLL